MDARWQYYSMHTFERVFPIVGSGRMEYQFIDRRNMFLLFVHVSLSYLSSCRTPVITDKCDIGMLYHRRITQSSLQV